MKFIFGRKIQMSQIFDEKGNLVPVTIVEASPCVVTQIKRAAHEGVDAVQVGFQETEARHVKKPQAGHLKNLPLMKNLREMPLEEAALKDISRGDLITVDTFEAGDTVEVVGASKGKGFQGVVRRHHFKGGPASHGHKDNLRMPGSIGAGGVQRVFKGMRMGGHMGDERVTIKNLTVMAVDQEHNILKIKGALPGGRNGIVLIKGSGALKIKKTEVPSVDASASEAAQTPAPEAAPHAEAHQEPAQVAAAN